MIPTYLVLVFALVWPNLLTPTLIYGAKTNNLTLGLFVSRSGSVVYEGVLPAVDLALDSINANSSILPDFVLDYDKDVIDSMVSCIIYHLNISYKLPNLTLDLFVILI